MRAATRGSWRWRLPRRLASPGGSVTRVVDCLLGLLGGLVGLLLDVAGGVLGLLRRLVQLLLLLRGERVVELLLRLLEFLLRLVEPLLDRLVALLDRTAG